MPALDIRVDAREHHRKQRRKQDLPQLEEQQSQTAHQATAHGATLATDVPAHAIALGQEAMELSRNGCGLSAATGHRSLDLLAAECRGLRIRRVEPAEGRSRARRAHVATAPCDSYQLDAAVLGRAGHDVLALYSEKELELIHDFISRSLAVGIVQTERIGAMPELPRRPRFKLEARVFGQRVRVTI